MKRCLGLAVGWFLVIFGLLIAPLPLPIGQIMALVGLGILIGESDAIRGWVRRKRTNNPNISRKITEKGHHLPGFLDRAIKLTEPLPGPRGGGSQG